MKLLINDDTIMCAGDQEGVVGPDTCLLDADDNLLAGTDWEPQGYTVAPFLARDAWQRLQVGISELLRRLIREGGASVPDAFRAEHYHRYVGDDEALHRKIAGLFAAGLPIDELPIDPRLVEDRIGELCGKRLTLEMPGTGAVFCMRAVRPQRRDNNPLHRDPWLDRLRNAVNLYVPVVGSDERSSLGLVPESHHWKESEISRTEGGATIGSRRYSVPALTGATRPVHAIRPNPGENEVLVFSPYLLHGGASNGNEDATRISLEIRLWRAPA